MRFEDHTDCIVCGGWHRCEFCPEQTPATLRSVLWDYWAAGIIAGRPHEATRACELLERLRSVESLREPRQDELGVEVDDALQLVHCLKPLSERKESMAAAATSAWRIPS